MPYRHHEVPEECKNGHREPKKSLMGRTILDVAEPGDGNTESSGRKYHPLTVLRFSSQAPIIEPTRMTAVKTWWTRQPMAGPTWFH
jgi:hypothetical protein